MFGARTADRLFEDWRDLAGRVIAKHNDGYVNSRGVGYSEQWLRENGMLESEYDLAASELISHKGVGPRDVLTVTPETSAAAARARPSWRSASAAAPDERARSASIAS